MRSALPTEFLRERKGDLLLLIGPANVAFLAVAMEICDIQTLGALVLEQLVHALASGLTVCLWGLLNIKQVAHSFVLIFFLLIEVADVAWRELGCVPSVDR